MKVQWSLIVILWCQYRRYSKEVLSRKLCTIKATNSKGTLNMFLRRSSPSSSMAWGKRHLGGGAVQWELGDGETDEAETHEDGGENTDEEGTVVATSDALVQPLAVAVEDVNTSEGNYKYCGLQSSTTTRKSLGLQFLKSIKSIICSTTDHNFVCLKRGASEKVLHNTGLVSRWCW